MTTNPHVGWQPNWAVPPGTLLEETLSDRGMSQAELARRMNRPVKTINEIVKGKAAITPETAIQLERVLSISASLWNNLETRYRAHLAQVEAHSQLERESDWVKAFPTQAMIRHGLIPNTMSRAEQSSRLLDYFEVSSPAGWANHWKSVAASFRQSSAFATSPEAVAVWLRWGEKDATEIECEPFDAVKLEESLAEIRSLTRSDPTVIFEDIVDLLRRCGVALVVTPDIPDTRLSGATRWLSPTKVLVQLSLRHRRDDQFWFSLFHELGHVLRGSRRQAYLDLDSGSAVFDSEEDEADQFARSTLIPAPDYERLRQATDYSREYVRGEAARIGVSPGIVVGRLQRDGLIAPRSLNDLKREIPWSDEVFR
jgi:HTH-type transcriptional regulator / antitoxin HigA